MKKRWMGFLLVLVLFFTQTGVVQAMTMEKVAEEEVREGTAEWKNPLFSDVIQESEAVSRQTGVEAVGISSYSSESAAAKYVRKQLEARKESFTFEYRGSDWTKTKLQDAMYSLYEKACTVTDSPQQGDYLRYHLIKINWKYSYTSKRATVTWTVSYSSTAAQEKVMKTRIAGAVSELGMTYDSDAVKIKRIHDYVCKNVSYYDDKTWNTHSAYSALSDGKAVCQGYATLFYAMCKQAGIEVRCVSGTGNNQSHLWNIVKLGDSWYNVDVTWDSKKTGVMYDYFMKSNMDFVNHSRDAEYKTFAFLSEHPIANESYEGNVGIPTIKSVTLLSASKVKLRWTPVDTAEGYYIYYATKKNGTYKKLQTVQGGAYNALNISGLTMGKTYYFKIRAYTTMFGQYTGSESAIKSVKIGPDTVTKLTLTAAKKKLKIKWKTVENAKGYEIRVTYKRGSQKITERLNVRASVKNTQSKTITGIKSGSLCSVKVRAYVTGSNGKKIYGNFSRIKKKKVK